MEMRTVMKELANIIVSDIFYYNRPNGIQFVAAAGTTEFAKRVQIQPGDIVSFKHHGYLLGSKKPKFPALYRKRTDLVWQDVVNNWKEQKPTPRGNSAKDTFC